MQQTTTPHSRHVCTTSPLIWLSVIGYDHTHTHRHTHTHTHPHTHTHTHTHTCVQVVYQSNPHCNPLTANQTEIRAVLLANHMTNLYNLPCFCDAGQILDEYSEGCTICSPGTFSVDGTYYDDFDFFSWDLSYEVWWRNMYNTVNISMHTNTFTHIHAHRRAHSHTHTHTHIHIYIYTHTHTHTHTHRRAHSHTCAN